MTPADALRDLLAAPLRFGDPGQLELLEVLRAAEQLVGTSKPCRNCQGSGVLEPRRVYCHECGMECDYCSGSQDCRECRGTGSFTYNREYVYMLTEVQIAELTQVAA
jgi:hypothetical protein